MDARDGAHQAVLDEERRHHHGLDHVLSVLPGPARPFLVVRDDDRLVRLRDPPHRPLAQRHPGPGGIRAQVQAGHHHQLLRHFVEHGQLPARDPEQGHGPLQDRPEDAVQLELARQVREGVQQRPLLGRSLPLRQQESRSTDADARLVRRRRQDLQVALVEGLAADPLDDQLPDRAVVHAQREPKLCPVVAVPVQIAGRGPELRVEGRRPRQVEPHRVELEGRVVQPLHDGAADVVLVLRLGDARAQPEERGPQVRELPGPGGPRSAAGSARAHGSRLPLPVRAEARRQRPAVTECLPGR